MRLGVQLAAQLPKRPVALLSLVLQWGQQGRTAEALNLAELGVHQGGCCCQGICGILKLAKRLELHHLRAA